MTRMWISRDEFIAIYRRNGYANSVCHAAWWELATQALATVLGVSSGEILVADQHEGLGWQPVRA